MSIIGVDTGGSFTRIWDGTGSVLREKTPRDYHRYVSFLSDLLASFQPISSIVVSLPAVVDSNGISRAPNLDENWVGKDIKADIQKRMHINSNVHVIQDTEAAGYGVQRYDLSNLEPTMIITLSTGVGGALVTKDQVMPLEIGAMPLNLSGDNVECFCGQRGCVEADLSGTAIFRRMQLPPEDLDDQNFWLKYGLQLGHLFWVLTALFKLRQILLIGGLSQRHKDFLAEATEYVRSNLRNMPMPRIQLCQLGDNTGVYGAYWLATVMSRPDTLSKAQR